MCISPWEVEPDTLAVVAIHLPTVQQPPAGQLTSVFTSNPECLILITLLK